MQTTVSGTCNAHVIAVDITTVLHDALNFAVSCFVSLQGMVAVCSLLVLMRKMMRKQMLFMIPSIGEWMIGEKREGNIVAIKQFTVSSNFK